MAEATITRKVAKHLKAMKLSGEPVEWVKIHGSGMQRAGEPDYSITYHGRSIKAELKDKGKSPTKLQKYRCKFPYYELWHDKHHFVQFALL
mgnify:CR=1 FL=1